MIWPEQKGFYGSTWDNCMQSRDDCNLSLLDETGSSSLFNNSNSCFVYYLVKVIYAQRQNNNFLEYFSFLFCRYLKIRFKFTYMGTNSIFISKTWESNDYYTRHFISRIYSKIDPQFWTKSIFEKKKRKIIKIKN